MLKIKVWVKENQQIYSQELRCLRPRRYMCSWDFKKLLKYVEDELYWLDINKDDVEEIVIYNEKEQWQQNIRKTSEV